MTAISGNRRGAGTRNDELALGHVVGQVAKEGRDIRGHARLRVSRAHPREILLADLLRQLQPGALGHRQLDDRLAARCPT